MKEQKQKVISVLMLNQHKWKVAMWKKTISKLHDEVINFIVHQLDEQVDKMFEYINTEHVTNKKHTKHQRST